MVFYFMLSIYQTMSPSSGVYPVWIYGELTIYNCAELPVGRRNYSSSCELPADVSRGVAHVRPDCKLPADVLSGREAQYSQELVSGSSSLREGGTYPHSSHLFGR